MPEESWRPQVKENMRLLAVEISGWLKIHLIGLAEYFKMDNTDNIYLKLKQQRINIFKNSKYYRVFNKNNKQVKNNCTNNFSLYNIVFERNCGGGICKFVLCCSSSWVCIQQISLLIYLEFP